MSENQPNLPERIGPYEIKGELGSGGMAVVYRARQPSLDREVAIKALAPEYSRSSDAIERFERESTLATQLTHPGITQIIDRGVDNGRYYIVMEYVRGCSLEDLLRDRSLAVHEGVDIAGQVASALAYAHSKGVVHRDVKPGNVLISSDSGVVKLADFGIAQFTEALLRGKTLTLTNVGMGTYDYMAPEQRLDARGVDARADQFSFGVVLYEMLTGQLPIGHFKRPERLRDDTPPLLSGIVMRCLQQSPADRYASFRELLADLDRVTLLNAQYRDTLARMAASVRRISGKATTGLWLRALGLGRRIRFARIWLRQIEPFSVRAYVSTVRERVSRLPRPRADWRAWRTGVQSWQPASDTAQRAGALVLALLALLGLALIWTLFRGPLTPYSPGFPVAARPPVADEPLAALREERDSAQRRGDARDALDAQWRIAEFHRANANTEAAATAYVKFAKEAESLEARAGKLAEALFWSGYYREASSGGRDDFEDAVAYYRRLYTEYPSSPFLPDALFRAARLLHEKISVPWRTDDQAYYQLVAGLYQRVIDEFPRNPVCEDAYWQLARLFSGERSVRDYARAVGLYQELDRRYPRTTHDALYQAAAIADREIEDRERAIELYQALLASRPGSPHAEEVRERLRQLH